MKIPGGSSGGGGGGDLVKISETVLVSPAATVTFSSIPGTYRALRLVFQTRTSTSANNEDVAVQFNGDTGSNYEKIFLDTGGNFGTDSASSIVVAQAPAASNDANFAVGGVIDIPNYKGTTFYKEVVGGIHYQGTGSPKNRSGLYGGSWKSTSAITSITLLGGSGGNFVTGSVFTLYGIN